MSRKPSVPLSDDLSPTAPDVPTLAVLGPDVVVAAVPATQAQLVAACTLLGFDAVVPGSWGDELIAEATLRHLGPRGGETVVLCACPVAHAVAAGDPRLSRHVLSLVAPGVAVARYVRMLYAPSRVRITYLGHCTGVTERDVDDMRSVAWVFDMLAARGVDPTVLPDEPAPGHRRYQSLPGGTPHPDQLRQAVRHELITVSGDDAAELAAAHIARGDVALVDLSAASACGCTGGAMRGDFSPRAVLERLEPPRATGDVLSPTIRPDLTLGAARVVAAMAYRPAATSAAGDREVQLPTVGFSGAPGSPHTPPARRRSRTSGIMRAIGGLAPATRSGEGRSLPRAYLGHRARRSDELRLTPPDGAGNERVVTLANAPLADAPPPRRSSGNELVVRLPHVEPYRVPPPPSRATSLQRLTLLVLAVAALLTVLVAALS
jgi:hypothetical protein